MSCMDVHAPRLFGSPKSIARSIKAYACEGAVSIPVGLWMYLVTQQDRNMPPSLTILWPVVLTSGRTFVALCLPGWGRHSISADNPVCDIVMLFFPMTSFMLSVWFAIVALFAFDTMGAFRGFSHAFLTFGFGWLAAANFVLCCGSLLVLQAALTDRHELQVELARRALPVAEQPESDQEREARIKLWTRRSFTIRVRDAPELGACPLCTICLVEYEEGDLAKVLSCGHVFHEDCVDPWLCHHKDRRCPMRCVLHTDAIVSGSPARVTPIVLDVLGDAPDPRSDDHGAGDGVLTGPAVDTHGEVVEGHDVQLSSSAPEVASDSGSAALRLSREGNTGLSVSTVGSDEGGGGCALGGWPCLVGSSCRDELDVASTVSI